MGLQKCGGKIVVVVVVATVEKVFWSNMSPIGLLLVVERSCTVVSLSGTGW